MKKLLNIFLTILITCSFLATSCEKIFAEEDYEIDNHDVYMVVSEDGTISITETIDVCFNENRHGIYVILPIEYQMDWNENSEIIRKNYRFPISNFKVLSNHKKEIENDGSNLVVRIGSASQYANKNETYKFSYEIHMRDLDLNGTQMLFMNIITSKWGTSTKKASFVIEMPKSIENCEVYTTTCKNNVLTESGYLDGLYVEVNEKRISGYTTEPLKTNEGITLKVMLPNDYFTFTDYNFFGKIAAIFALIFSMAVIVIFVIYGKDEPLVTTVEFHAPKGLSSAEVGTIIDETVDQKDIVSLILDWGRRGLIVLKEKENDLIIEKKREIESECNQYEKVLFTSIFEDDDIVEISKLKNNFYNSITKCKKMIQQHFKGQKRISTEISIVLQYFLAVISGLPMAFMTYLAVYFYSYEVVLAITFALISMMFWLLASLLNIFMYLKRFVIKKGEKVRCLILMAFFIIIPTFIMLYYCYKLKINVMLSISIVLMQIEIEILIRYMRKRTSYGNEILGKVLGLKEFIEVADQQRLNMMLEENPYYFYDIMPYAYAFGLMEKWCDKFKSLNVEPCDWYSSSLLYNTSYESLKSLGNQVDYINTELFSSTSSSSVSGSDFSSGSGFGGSGGGSW